MKTAEEWAREAVYCARIHATEEQKLTSLKGLFSKALLDAYKAGMTEAVKVGKEVEAGDDEAAARVLYAIEQFRDNKTKI